MTTLVGPKVLLIGASGSGKSFSVGTLVDWASRNKSTVRVLFTENSVEALLGYWADKGGKVPDALQYHVVTTPSIPFKSLLSAAKDVGRLSYEMITKLTDPNRSENNPYEKILLALADFKDDRTGASLGNIGDWGTDTVLVVDSLSELANACMKMVVGNKPTASQGDYGVAQNNLMNLLRFLTQSLRCTVVMTAHIQRQQDEITGGVKLMTKAIGKAMGDDIPQLFSEVIGAVREGTNWYWDTAHPSLDTKTRYLPIASKQKPDFATIMDKWVKRSAA